MTDVIWAVLVVAGFLFLLLIIASLVRLFRGTTLAGAEPVSSEGRVESSDVTSTRVTQRVAAPRAAVYRALIDPDAVARWMVPTGMTSEVHAFEPRVGGFFRISLTYEEPTAAGKTTAHTDTYHGTFAELVPDERVVQVIEFETTDPGLQGRMTSTMVLSDDDGGTTVVATHTDLPPGLDPAANETGWRISLGKLADLVEGSVRQR